MSASTSNLARIALIGWLLQPLYIATEFVAAAAMRTEYSFAQDTISELGILACRGAAYPDVCSPRHEVMNGSFIVFGALLVLGAPALLATLPRTRPLVATVCVFVIAGFGSIAVGLVPLDRSADLHYAVAVPVFVARPVALALGAWVLARTYPRVARVTWGFALVTLAGVVGFAMADTFGAPKGTLERIALWPADIWFALVAVTLMRGAASQQRDAGPAA